jgi:putative ABC transport system permease protein
MKGWFLQISPIFASFKKQRLVVLLQVIEIAILTAVISNAAQLIADTAARLSMPTGVDEPNIGVIRSIGVVGSKDTTGAAENLRLLHSVSGVEHSAYGAPPLLSTSTYVYRRNGRVFPQMSIFFRGAKGYPERLG